MRGKRSLVQSRLDAFVRKQIIVTILWCILFYTNFYNSHRCCVVFCFSMTRFARVPKKKHLDATPWGELSGGVVGEFVVSFKSHSQYLCWQLNTTR